MSGRWRAEGLTMPGKLIRLENRSAPGPKKIKGFGAAGRGLAARAINRGPRLLALPALLTELERLPAIVERLLVEGTPKEIRALRISAQMLRRMAKEAQLAFEAELRCAAARQLLDHRLGEMCRRFLRRGRPKKVADGDHLRLTDIVKNKTQSSRCQEIAKVPISEARRYHQHCFKHQIEITDAGLYEWVNRPAQGALNWHRPVDWHAEPNNPSPTATGEWYAPQEIFDAMGIVFDIDVASPGRNVVPWTDCGPAR